MVNEATSPMDLHLTGVKERTLSGEVGAEVVFVPGCCGEGPGGFEESYGELSPDRLPPPLVLLMFRFSQMGLGNPIRNSTVTTVWSPNILAMSNLSQLVLKAANICDHDNILILIIKLQKCKKKKMMMLISNGHSGPFPNGSIFPQPSQKTQQLKREGAFILLELVMIINGMVALMRKWLK